jgi:hypothetical protein
MIQGLNTAEGLLPVIICDHCGKQIIDAELGAVMIPDSNPYPNGNKRINHVHKGECHDKLEKKEGGVVIWIEMTAYFTRVLKSVNLSSKDLE